MTVMFERDESGQWWKVSPDGMRVRVCCKGCHNPALTNH